MGIISPLAEPRSALTVHTGLWWKKLCKRLGKGDNTFVSIVTKALDVEDRGNCMYCSACSPKLVSFGLNPTAITSWIKVGTSWLKLAAPSHGDHKVRYLQQNFSILHLKSLLAKFSTDCICNPKRPICYVACFPYHPQP